MTDHLSHLGAKFCTGLQPYNRTEYTSWLSAAVTVKEWEKVLVTDTHKPVASS